MTPVEARSGGRGLFQGAGAQNRSRNPSATAANDPGIRQADSSLRTSTSPTGGRVSGLGKGRPAVLGRRVPGSVLGLAFTFDGLGRLMSDANPAGGMKTLARQNSPQGFTVTLSTAFDALRNWIFGYEVRSLPTGDRQYTDTAPDGTKAVTTVAPSGTVTFTTPEGMTSTTSRQADPRFGLQAPLLTTISKSPAGLTQTTAVTRSAALANPTDVLSATSLSETRTVNGRAYNLTYTSADHKLVSTTPAGRAVTITLDANGRASLLQRPGMFDTQLLYDQLGRLSTVNQGARTYAYSYDAGGYLEAVSDPLRTVSFTRDLGGRVRTEVLPGGRSVSFGYDASGNMTSLAPPGRPAHGFGYTPIDLTTSYTPPAASGTGLLSTSFSYNLDGSLSQVLLPDQSTIAQGYDRGRLSSLTSPRGASTIDYDPSGRVLALTTPEAHQVAFGYDGSLPVSELSSGANAGSVGRSFDNDFRLQSLFVNGTTLSSFQYDADGLLTQAGALTINRDPASGRIAGTIAGSVTTANTYSGYGELESVTAYVSGSTAYGYTLHRDQAGRITGKTETIQGRTTEYVYGHDDAGRLTSVAKDGAVVESYAFDDNGNRLSGTNSAGTASGSYDAQDRLLAYGAAAYEFGPAGDLKTKSDGSLTTWYVYDSPGTSSPSRAPTGC
jgi:YD repeat-containing protein